MQSMKIAPEIRLSTEERQQLKEIVRKGAHPARMQTRARILLMAAERSLSSRGRATRRTNSNQTIAESLQLSARTVSRVRQAFVQGGLKQALYDQHHPGRPVELDGQVEAKLIMLACSSPPEGRSRWTLQLLADQMIVLGYAEHLSDTWVMQRLKKTNCVLGS
jgi:hypothetical protein